MKWLILLALVACGKHQEPKALDYRDSDGDQIQNYKETELDKYVANFEGLDEVRGSIKFYNGTKFIELPFTNKKDLRSSALELMTANEDRLKTEEYFSEWTKVNFINKAEMVTLSFKQYKINVEISSGSDMPDEIALMDGGTSKTLSTWKPLLNLSLSDLELKALIEGKAHLVFRKKFMKSGLFAEDSETTIKEKTYRVHYFDGKESKILYVSNELDYPSFLNLMKVSNSVAIHKEEEIFHFSEALNPQWFERQLANGDKVVVKALSQELRDKLKSRYTYQKKIISRVNGDSVTKIELNNPVNAKIFVSIRPLEYMTRKFQESSVKKTHGQGGGGREGNAGRYECRHYYRTISKEYKQDLGFLDMVQSVSTPEIFGNMDTIVPKADENGNYWELLIENVRPDLEIKLIPRPTSSFVVTGEYDNSCKQDSDVRERSYRTNTEGKLSLEVESYVEKIE